MPDESVCANYRDALAAYAAGVLPSAQRRQIEEHLAQCARCSTELAQWQHIGEMAREAPIPVPAPDFPVAWEQLRQELTKERASALMDRSPEQHLHEIELDETFGALPNGVYRAGTPAISPTGANHMKFTRSWMAVAAMLALAVISAGVFSLLASQRHDGHGVATNAFLCSPSQISAQLPQEGMLTDIAMTSPNDGWAVGFSVTTNGAETPLLMRYQNCHWAPVTVPALARLRYSESRLTSIAMVSAKEGWATGIASAPATDSRLLLHYDNGQWQPVTLPATIGKTTLFDKVVMVSPNEGWLLGAVQNQDGNGVRGMLIHYMNGMWSVVTPPFAYIYDIAAVAPNDLFISGATSDIAGQVQYSLVGHYHDGAWTTTPFPGLIITTLKMLSPTDGWITASAQVTNNTNESDQHPVLHYNGQSWSRVDLHAPDNTSGLYIISDTDIWAFSVADSFHYYHGQWQTISWLKTPQAPQGSDFSGPTAVVRTSAGDYWLLTINSTTTQTSNGPVAGSSPMFMHFANGAWSVYGAPPNS